MSQQKNSILINEHALNREPVPLIEKLSITGQKLKAKCLKNGSDRLRKGQLHRVEALWTSG